MRWVIGDVHGMFAQLETLLTELSRRDSTPTFCFVGDYVNRGPDTRRVLDLLVTLENGRFCRGNHDDVLDLILHDAWLGGEDDAYEPLAAAVWFLKHGLIDTLESYPLNRDDLEFHRYHPGPELLELIRSGIPRSHKDFIRNLPIALDDPDFLIVHAFWPSEEDNAAAHVLRRLDDAAMCHRVVWERYTPSQITAAKPWTRPIFAGHTPVQNYAGLPGGRDNTPIRGPRLTLLDTAIALGADGKLTAVCIEDGRVVQVDRGCKVIERP